MRRAAEDAAEDAARRRLTASAVQGAAAEDGDAEWEGSILKYFFLIVSVGSVRMFDEARQGSEVERLEEDGERRMVTIVVARKFGRHGDGGWM